MKPAHVGAWGEVLASRYLRDLGYEILSANFRTYMGEIDIVATDGKCIAFVEVKTRGENMIATPAEAVNYSKQRKISAAAAIYLKRYSTKLSPRFDVIEVYLDSEDKPKKINHLRAAFYPSFGKDS